MTDNKLAEARAARAATATTVPPADHAPPASGKATMPWDAAPGPASEPASVEARTVAPTLPASFPEPPRAPDGSIVPPGHVVNPNFVQNLAPDGRVIPPGHVVNPNFELNNQREFNPDDPLGQVRTNQTGGDKAAAWKVRVTSAPGVAPTPRSAGRPSVTGPRGPVSVRGGTPLPAPPQHSGGIARQTSGHPVSGARIVTTQGTAGIRVVPTETPIPTGNTVGQPPGVTLPSTDSPILPGAPVGSMSVEARPGSSAVRPIELDPSSPITVMLSTHDRPQLLRQQMTMISRQTLRPYDVELWVNPSSIYPSDAPAIDAIPGMVHQSKRDMGPWRRFLQAAEFTTPYVAVFDEDSIPSGRWFELAVARIKELEEKGIPVVVAAAGTIYHSDDSSDIELIGPEAPNASEVEVDVGRGAWVCSVATMRAFREFQRVHERGWSTHLAAVVQHIGGLTLVLPYDSQRSTWGMINPPSHQGSISQLLDSSGVGAKSVAREVYEAYRGIGWRPMVVDAAVEPAADEASGSPEATAEASV